MKTFDKLIEKTKNDPKILRMKKYTQHGKVSTYDHCLRVARNSYRLCKALKMKVKEEDLVRGAMLHDYFLYDWHTHEGRLHGLTHPDTAASNAKRDFDLTEKEENIIKSHMWPLTLKHIPKSREAVVVCLVDKICSLKETLLNR